MTPRNWIFLAFCAGLPLVPGLARADACGDEIARTEMKLQQSRASGAAALPESNFATMHRQPTAATVARAREESDSRAETALAKARAEQREGKTQDCLRALRTIETE